MPEQYKRERAQPFIQEKLCPFVFALDAAKFGSLSFLVKLGTLWLGVRLPFLTLAIVWALLVAFFAALFGLISLLLRVAANENEIIVYSTFAHREVGFPSKGAYRVKLREVTEVEVYSYGWDRCSVRFRTSSAPSACIVTLRNGWLWYLLTLPMLTGVSGIRRDGPIMNQIMRSCVDVSRLQQTLSTQDSQ